MSNEVNTNPAFNFIKDLAEKCIVAGYTLKSKNPKVFYGAVAGLVLLLIIVL